ncbi:hypothetical protein ACOME3_007448 [Neoechinorhynchus agilis]
MINRHQDFYQDYFTYIAPIYFRANQSLSETDICGIPEKRTVSQKGAEIESRWNSQMNSKGRTLWKIFLRVFFKQILYSTFLFTFEEIFLLLMVPLLKKIFKYMQGEISTGTALVCLAFLILCYHLSSISRNHCLYEASCMGFELRASFTRFVYAKVCL